MAKRLGGRWLVRMEDLDGPRVVPGMADDILRVLELLGLTWDGEILRQSERTEVYQAALERLAAQGLTYPCGCSRSDIARVSSAPHDTGGERAYPGTCRAGLQPGKPARAVRVRTTPEPIRFCDCVMGEMTESFAASCGDFVIRRADGPFAYHLAVVVDDADQGVNQVVRGADLLTSTPRQIYLQRLLGLPTPAYCHLPLVTGPDGAKLSKRDNAVSLACGRDIAREGGRLIGGALKFLGNPVPDSLSRAPATELLCWAAHHFDPARIPRTFAPFPSV